LVKRSPIIPENFSKTFFTDWLNDLQSYLKIFQKLSLPIGEIAVRKSLDSVKLQIISEIFSKLSLPVG